MILRLADVTEEAFEGAIRLAFFAANDICVTAVEPEIWLGPFEAADALLMLLPTTLARLRSLDDVTSLRDSHLIAGEEIVVLALLFLPSSTFARSRFRSFDFESPPSRSDADDEVLRVAAFSLLPLPPAALV